MACGGRSAPEVTCPSATEIPDGLTHYRSTPLFDERTIPAALRSDHCTKLGVWGLIRGSKGRLRYGVTDSRRAATSVELTTDSPPGIIEPAILHRVDPIGEVEFQVEFWKAV